MTEDIDPHARLARRVYRLIGAYVRHRTEERSEIKENNLPKNEKGYRVYPQKYREAREKVAKDAFLAMRGRNERDFTEYFTGTILRQGAGVHRDFAGAHQGVGDRQEPIHARPLRLVLVAGRQGRIR